MDWEERQEKQNREMAHHRSEIASKKRGGRKCRECGLFGCVCDVSLPQWFREDRSYDKFKEDGKKSVSATKIKQRRKVFPKGNSDKTL